MWERVCLHVYNLYEGVSITHMCLLPVCFTEIRMCLGVCHPPSKDFFHPRVNTMTVTRYLISLNHVGTCVSNLYESVSIVQMGLLPVCAVEYGCVLVFVTPPSK